MLPDCFGKGIANLWLEHRDYVKWVKDALASNRPADKGIGTVGVALYIIVILATKGKIFLLPQCKQGEYLCKHLPICLSNAVYAIMEEA